LYQLRTLADRIRSGEISLLYIPTYQPEIKHWTLFKIDVRARLIRFGDSLGGTYVPADLARLQRFLVHATSATPPVDVGPPLRMNKQLDGYSCAITIWDLICEEVFRGDPWIDKEKHLRRVEYAILLGLHSGLVTANDLELPSESLRYLKTDTHLFEWNSDKKVFRRSPSIAFSDESVEMYDRPPSSAAPSSPSSRASVLSSVPEEEGGGSSMVSEEDENDAEGNGTDAEAWSARHSRENSIDGAPSSRRSSLSTGSSKRSVASKISTSIQEAAEKIRTAVKRHASLSLTRSQSISPSAPSRSAQRVALSATPVRKKRDLRIPADAKPVGLLRFGLHKVSAEEAQRRLQKEAELSRERRADSTTSKSTNQRIRTEAQMEKKRLGDKLRKRQIRADAAEMRAAEVKAAAKEVGPGSPSLTMNTISRSVLDGARYAARLRHC
jgi:hypothetical protein